MGKSCSLCVIREDAAVDMAATEGRDAENTTDPGSGNREGIFYRRFVKSTTDFDTACDALCHSMCGVCRSVSIRLSQLKKHD